MKRDSKGRFAKRRKGARSKEAIILLILIAGMYAAHGVAMAINSVEPEKIVVEMEEHKGIEVEYITVIDWDEDRIRREVEEQANKYGVSVVEMWDTIKCENPDLIPELQSLIVQDGVREDSWGLAQIHLPSHPDVTKQEAQDPKFAINFMAKNFASGDKWMWTCWRNLYN